MPRLILLLLLLLPTAFFLSGCQTDPEGREFFYKGWQKPQQGADQRLYGHGANVPPE